MFDSSLTFVVCVGAVFTAAILVAAMFVLAGSRIRRRRVNP
jgi:hypothetical protein